MGRVSSSGADEYGVTVPSGYTSYEEASTSMIYSAYGRRVGRGRVESTPVAAPPGRMAAAGNVSQGGCCSRRL